MTAAPVTLGAFIRDRRERRQMRQYELAAAAVLSVGHLRRIETDKILPSRMTYLRIADALDVPVEEMDRLAVAATVGGAA